jgi:hypothetical protein
MPDLTDDEWQALTTDLAQRVAAVAPDWTDPNESDPGVTTVQLMAFLGDSLLRRRGAREGALARLRDVGLDRDGADALPCSDLATLTRPRYFTGRLLGVDDFELEQAYGQRTRRRHNLLLHGVGIARGLGVTVEAPDDGGVQHVVVTPGVAIGTDGEELVICEPWTTALRAAGSSCYVTVRLVERLVAVVPGARGEEASRIEETAALDVTGDVEPGSLPIARLERVADAWSADTAFREGRSG